MGDSTPPENPALEDAECGDINVEFINYLKRKINHGDFSNLINIGRLPNDNKRFKIMVESDRLSQRIDKKLNEINRKYSSLEADFVQLEKLVGMKKIKSNENIQANKEITCLKIGENMKDYYSSQEKAKNLKSAINEATAKIKIDDAQASTQVEQDIMAMKNILAMTQEQFDQIQREKQEKMLEERRRLEREINNMKEKVAKEKDRLEREIKGMKDNEAQEKNRIESEIQKLKDEIKRIPIKIQDMRRKNDEIQRKMSTEKNNLEKEIDILRTTLNKAREESQNNIRGLKQQQAELKRKKEAEMNVMKLDETRVKRTIENMQNMLDINEDQNRKTIEKYENNIKVIQQVETDKRRQFEAEIQSLKKRESRGEN